MTRPLDPEPSRFLKPGEVAEAFNVNIRTIVRWAEAGELDYMRTLGGHRRYYRAQVNAILAQQRADREWASE